MNKALKIFAGFFFIYASISNNPVRSQTKQVVTDFFSTDIDTIRTDSIPEKKIPVIVRDINEYIPVSNQKDIGFIRIKSNALYWIVPVINLGAEIPIGENYSIDVLLLYSPYSINSTWKIKVMGVQPEFRYWLNEHMKNHFIGLHAHIGWFNVAVDSRTRYQDNKPLWGAGISYGYALPIKGPWGVEFTLGAGYARISYDSFYNVSNGKKFESDTKNYWGITRLGVTFSYKF